MIEYPSITGKYPEPKPGFTGEPVFLRKAWVYDKLDGSNVRAGWNQKKGFYKFGSRKELIDETHPFLGEAPDAMREHEEALTEMAKHFKWKKCVFFFEFLGENSFAGYHEKDDPKRAVLLDIYADGQMIDPRTFWDLCYGNVPCASCLYSGPVDEELIRSVKDSTLEGMTFEGVIVKGFGPGKKSPIERFKIKSDAWYDKLRSKCGDDNALFEKLR